ncbi:MAG: uroporphyrinogen decarboxylase family protein [Candidatus Humimicrobiaceae bacterium]
MEKRLDESYLMALETNIELIWQPDNVTSDMTPPNSFKEYILPLYKKYSKQVKEKNKRFVVHLDGKIKHLNTLLNNAGIDVIESMSLPEIGGDLTLSEAYINFPNSVIIPNFPSNWNVLPEKKIKEKLKILLNDRNDKRPFMLQVSEDLPDNEWKKCYRS